MGRSRKRTLHIAPEATYGVDPSSDGSGYTPIPARGVGDMSDQLQVLETLYFTGELEDTIPVPGQDGAELTFSTPLIGLATAAGDGETPGAADWLGVILEHLFGVRVVRDGTTMATSSTSLDLTAAGGRVEDDMSVVFDSALNLGRSQWTRLNDAGPTDFTVTPPITAPASGAVVYGHEGFYFTDDGGATLSVVYTDDDLGTYVLGGGRITSASITGDAGQLAVFNVSMRFSRAIEDSANKTALPPSLAAPAVTPLILEASPVWFGETQYATQSINLDFGVEATPIPSTAGLDGRADDVIIRLQPNLTIQPLRTEVQRQLKRQITLGETLVHIGAGVYNGTTDVLNTMCLNLGQMYVGDAPFLDQGGVARNSLVLNTVTAGLTTANARRRPFQIARA